MPTHEGFYSSTSQVSWTCNALLSGRSIGHDNEIAEAKGWRLSAIIHRLKRRYGWPILTEYSGPENHARYKLAPGTDRSKLEYPASARHLAERGHT